MVQALCRGLKLMPAKFCQDTFSGHKQAEIPKKIHKILDKSSSCEVFDFYKCFRRCLVKLLIKKLVKNFFGDAEFKFCMTILMGEINFLV